MKSSRVTISPMSFPKNRAWLPLLFLLLKLSAIPLSSSYSSSFPPQISYSQYCNSIVLESTWNDLEFEVGTSFPRLSEGYFTGGQNILPENPESPFTIPKSVRLRTKTLTKTDTEGVLRIEAGLNFRGGSVYGVYGGNRTINGVMHLNSFHPRSPRVFPQRGRVTFDLRGFWSVSSGKICLVGTGNGYTKEGKHLLLSAVVKLNYPKNATIRTNLVTGTVESLDQVDNVNHFDKISILGFSGSRYEYTLTSEAEKECSVSDTVENENSLNLGKSSCSELQRLFSGFELEYSFAASLPRFMSFSSFQCSDKRRLHLNLGFYNSSSFAYRYHPLVAQTTWVSEGIWDGEKNQICLVACPVMNSTDSFNNASVGDCTIGLNIRIPGVFSIRERSAAVGTIRSNKKRDDSGFFESIAFRSLDRRVRAIPGLKYNYTQMDRAKKSCEKKVRKTRGKRYPDGHYSGDMRFDLSVKNTLGQIVWGYMNPLTIDDKFYADTVTSAVYVDAVSTTSVPLANEEQNTIVSEPAVNILKPNQSLMNVSYTIGFTLSSNFKWDGLYSRDVSSGSHTPIDISAEGVYDAENGTLCMVGCRDLGSYNHNSSSMDCEILINVMLSPLNPKAGDNLKGTIKSSRQRKDPFYFEPLELFSSVISSEQIIERMDLEITMVLISLTLACVFIGLQLFYVKKNPDVLPSTSLLMLVVLTLGYMMPLVLNFEAFFKNTNRQSALLWSGGWLEGNEVVVRVVTMVAFLLQFRLLQLAWSSRLADGSKGNLWVAEKTTVYLCLPLYLAGGLIAGFVHWKTYKTSVSKFHLHLFAEAQHSIWEDLRSYCGLVLDGFLFPQILLNLFLNLNVKALASSFYVGTTIVRLLPHAYDAYRSHRYAARFNASYIYANPNGDLYSNAWDVIIPCGGVIFAVIIYLQQRYGGACILPRRFRRSIDYEKVPVVSG